MERWEEAKQESLHGKYKIRKKYSMKTFPELHNKSKKKKKTKLNMSKGNRAKEKVD